MLCIHTDMCYVSFLIQKGKHNKKSAAKLRGGSVSFVTTARGDLSKVHEQMLTNRSRTSKLNIMHILSRTVDEQTFTNNMLLLLNII